AAVKRSASSSWSLGGRERMDHLILTQALLVFQRKLVITNDLQRVRGKSLGRQLGQDAVEQGGVVDDIGEYPNPHLQEGMAGSVSFGQFDGLVENGFNEFLVHDGRLPSKPVIGRGSYFPSFCEAAARTRSASALAVASFSSSSNSGWVDCVSRAPMP